MPALSALGTTQCGWRWIRVSDSIVGASASTICTLVQPVPTTATLLPAKS